MFFNGTALATIGTSLFEQCSALTTITIPSSVTTINSRAFYQCSALLNITIPSSVNSIGNYAFQQCSQLESVTFNGTALTTINTQVFYQCSALTTITIPSSVSSIGGNAFYQCTQLASVTLSGTTLTSIGQTAFKQCSALRTITIPTSVNSIGAGAFQECSLLASVTFNGNAFTSIGIFTFQQCSALTSIIIPSSVSSIDNNAFYECSQLASVTFNGNALTSIGQTAFYGCSALTTLTIPSSVSSIGSQAFFNCNLLASVTFLQITGNFNTIINNSAIVNGTNQKTAYYYSSVSSYNALKTPGGFTNIVSMSTGTVSPVLYVTGYSSTLTYVSNFFSWVSGTTYTLYNSSDNNKVLGSFVAPSSPTTTTYTFNNVKIDPIGVNTLYIPNIDYKIDVTVLPLQQTQYGVIYTIIDTTTAYVSGFDPSNISANTTILSSVTFGVYTCAVVSIGTSAFQQCSALTTLTIPSSVSSIGQSAFQQCSALTTLTIPTAVSSIGTSAFQQCTALTTITIPSSVNSIGTSVFQQCTALTTLTIPSSVNSIGTSAFQQCYALTSIIIPSSVSSIDNNAFYQCSQLASVTFNGNALASIGTSAFESCSALTTLTIPSSVNSIGTGAFYQCTQLARVIFLQNTGNFDFITNQIVNGTGQTAYYYNTVDNSDKLKNPGGFTFKSVITKTATPDPCPSGYNLTFTYVINYEPWINGNTYTLYNSSDNSKYLGSFYAPSTGTPSTTYTFENVSIVPTGVNILNIPGVADNIQVIVEAICFKEDTKILTDKGYVPIQDLRKGTLVKTLLHGYVPIDMIGKRIMNHIASHKRIKEQLYKCSNDQYPEVFEDLVITGCHSILINEFDSYEEKQKAIEVNNGYMCITDNKYRLPACVDERAKVYEIPGTYTIYHFALENNDYYMNYGVYANGLLVETCSKRYITELANMELIE